MSVRTEEAASLRPAAGTIQRARVYRNPSTPSSANLLAGAAEVLLLLQLPLAGIERTALTCLFDRRLRQAYEAGK